MQCSKSKIPIFNVRQVNCQKVKYGLFAFNLTEITVPAHFDKTRNFFCKFSIGVDGLRIVDGLQEKAWN